MTMVELESLPIVIFSEIQLYLTNYEYRQFLATSNSFVFNEIRGSTIYYPLNYIYSEQFCTFPAFQERLFSRIDDKSKQRFETHYLLL
jgi:hypothetical protein